MASSQFGANTATEWRQKRRLNLVGLKGISSPLFRESLIDTWGLAWRTEDNASIVSLFSESRHPSTAVSLPGAWLASKLELSLLIFADASPGAAHLCLWLWRIFWRVSAVIFFKSESINTHLENVTHTLRKGLSQSHMQDGVWLKSLNGGELFETFTIFEDVICWVTCIFYKKYKFGIFRVMLHRKTLINTVISELRGNIDISIVEKMGKLPLNPRNIHYSTICSPYTVCLIVLYCIFCRLSWPPVH